MGRRKKQVEEVEKEQPRPIIHGDAKRSVVAIFLFALAILFVLGFLSDAKIVEAGVLGSFLNSVAGWMFGVGKYVSPLVLVIAGVILLFRKETLFYVSKLIGLSIAFASILGLVHILAYDPDKMLKVAKLGEGGGFLGYVFAIILLKLTGTVGGSVILVAFFLIGITVAFNFSLVNVIRKFIENRTQPVSHEAQEDDAGEEEIEEVFEDPIIEGEKEDRSKKTEFVQEPDEGNEDDEESRR